MSHECKYPNKAVSPYLYLINSHLEMPFIPVSDPDLVADYLSHASELAQGIWVIAWGYQAANVVQDSSEVYIVYPEYNNVQMVHI